MLLLLVPAAVAAVVVRRVYLRRLGGSIDCAARRGERTDERGWHLGVARFGADRLEWYRLFSLRPRASLRIDRRVCELLERREPTAGERRALQPGVEVVRLDCGLAGTPRFVELALDPPAVTVLMTWLESAPPGSEY